MAERKAFVLRINKELWTALQRMAAQDMRSVNAEIEYLLRDAVKKRGYRLGETAPDENDHR